MRNDSRGRRIEIGGKDFERGRGDERLGRRSWLRRQGAPSRHYPLTGNYPSSGRLSQKACASARARCVFFFSLSLYLPSTLPPLFNGRKNRGAESPLPIVVGGQRARERSSEEPPREQRSCDRGSSTVERRRDEVPRVSPAVHLSVNRRPSGKLPALSVHRATAWVLLFSGHCSTVFGTIRARNAPFSPIPTYPCHPERLLRSADRPPFLSCESCRLLSGLAQTCNSNKRKIRAAVRR